MKVISGENLSLEYQNRYIFKKLDIHVNENEIVAILGSSGVGKTTLLNILAGLLKPNTGQVCLKDQNITNESGHVGYMLQKDLLLEFKTTIDNVSLPLILKGLGKKEARDTALKYFDIFNLKGCENFYSYKLSGGMKQRAAFLRTFLYNNEIMLLDEPFSALDAITKNELYDWFIQTIKRLNTSVLFITHDIDEAIRLADRVYILVNDNGVCLKEVEIKNKKDNMFYLSSDFLVYKQKILGLLENKKATL